MILHTEDYEMIKHFFKICLNNLKFETMASFKNINTSDHASIIKNINPRYLVLEPIEGEQVNKINMKYQNTINGFKEVELKTSDDVILREVDVITMMYDYKAELAETTQSTYINRGIDCMGYVALVNLYIKKFLPLLKPNLRLPLAS